LLSTDQNKAVLGRALESIHLVFDKLDSINIKLRDHFDEQLKRGSFFKLDKVVSTNWRL